MNIWFLAAALIVANGFGRRFAGGLLSQWLGPIGGSQVGRGAQAAIAGASVAVMAWNGLLPPLGALWAAWALVAATMAATFLGATWGYPGYSLRWPFIDMRVSRMVARNLVDTIGLAVNGMMACSALAACMWAVGMSPWPMVLAGLARAPAFWLAAAWCPDWRTMGFWKLVHDPVRWIPQPTAMAEFYSGMALGAGLVATLILGA